MIVEYDLALPTPQTYSGVLASLKNWLNRSDLDSLLANHLGGLELLLLALFLHQQRLIDLDLG